MSEIRKTIKAAEITKVQANGLYQKSFKRVMDVVISLSAIILLLPIIIVTAVLVKMKLGSPVIFKQKRPGYKEDIFTMYKFRTMTDERDKDGKLLPDDIRLTKFGKFLRSTSLDELPELFNIIKGDMSIVGPRPQLVRDLVFMDEIQRRRQTILPGLTGWAQVNGRNGVSWEEKFQLDNEYLTDISLKKDIQIIIKTFVKVFERDGIAAEGMETAEDFGDYLLRTGKIDKERYDQGMKYSKKLLNK